MELNLETAGFFSELVVACAEADGAEDPRLTRALAELSRRERVSRERRIGQACDFREALDAFARRAIALGEKQAMGAPPPRRSRAPRHAAAIAVAIGFMGCRSDPTWDHGVAEAPPPPLAVPKPVPPEDAGPTLFQNDVGVAEAAPPPLDPQRVPVPMPPDAGKPPVKQGAGAKPKAPRDAGAAPVPEPVKPQWRRDHGVAEAAPPPLDEERRRRLIQNDVGVAEAAPPPMPVTDLTVTVTPAARILSNGARVEGPVKLNRNRNGFLQIGTGGDPVNDPFVVFIDYKWSGAQLSLRVECTPAVQVSGGGQSMPSPASLTFNLNGRSTILVTLEDPKTKTRMEVRLAQGR